MQGLLIWYALSSSLRKFTTQVTPHLGHKNMFRTPSSILEILQKYL